jgi:acetylornithine deacetylase/succinyl-diaminopimelate desuccinylase-like protein
MGATTVNVGVMATEGDSAALRLNVRYPRGLTADGILETVRERIREYDSRFKTGLTVQRSSVAFEPIFVDPGSVLVKHLLDAYREVYGREEKPISTPGTTYAKELPGAVSFGPAQPGSRTRAHAADEYVTVEELDLLVRCYATAWFKLTRPQ